jgi:hypothetical protein
MKPYRSPWWVSQQWIVETIASRDAHDDSFKKGDWIEIYVARTKKQAADDARTWTERTRQQTRVVPGPGHKTRRGF